VYNSELKAYHNAYHQRKNLALQCSPISIAWTPKEYPEGCINIVAMALSHASINLVTDALTFALPLVLVLAAPINQAEKSKHTLTFTTYTTIDVF
jgi:hypothetical protein